MRWGAAIVAALVALTVSGALCPARATSVFGPAPSVANPFPVRSGGVVYPTLAQDAIWNVLFAPTMASLRGASDNRLSEPDRIAFWINSYNYLTIELIVREWRARKGRLKSIKEIASPWSRPKWTVAGRSVTLDQIEHEILRKEFREPRIHFALVCASKSCPALRPTGFQAEFLDAQLDSSAREFVLDPSRNDFTPRGGVIRISKIFDWYGKDFVGVYSDYTLEQLYGRETGAVLAYVSRFLPAETIAALRTKRARVTYLPYDWSLNIAP